MKNINRELFESPSENQLPQRILSKKDLNFFLECDRLSRGENGKSPFIIGNEIWQFQRILQKLEYLQNCKNGFLWKPILLFYHFRFHLLSIRLGYSIPTNCIGPGLAIVHRGTIVINQAVNIGANCRIHVDVNIGATSKQIKAPQIGNNVYIGPGAKIIGDIRIADGVVIGAGAVVNKSVLEKNITVGGVPAKKISNNDSTRHINKGTDIYFRIHSYVR